MSHYYQCPPCPEWAITSRARANRLPVARQAGLGKQLEQGSYWTQPAVEEEHEGQGCCCSSPLAVAVRPEDKDRSPFATRGPGQGAFTWTVLGHRGTVPASTMGWVFSGLLPRLSSIKGGLVYTSAPSKVLCSMPHANVCSFDIPPSWVGFPARFLQPPPVRLLPT